jgi:hypothetical protein
MVTDIKQIFGNTQELRECLYGEVDGGDVIYPIDTDAVMYYNKPKSSDGKIVRAKNFMVVFSPCEKFEDNIEPLKCPFVDGLETYNVTEGDHTNISFAQSFFDFIDGTQLTDNNKNTTTTWNVSDTDFLFVRDRKGAWYTNYLETIPDNETYTNTSRTLEQFVEEVIITEIENYTELESNEKRQFLLFGSHEGGGYGACRSMVHIGKLIKADKANSSSPDLFKNYAGIFSFTIFAYNFQTDILFQELLKSTPIPGEYTEDIFPNLSVLPNDENQVDRTDDNIPEEIANLYNLGHQIEDILTDPTIPITMKVGGGHLFEELDGLGRVGENNLETPEDYNLWFLYNTKQYVNGLGEIDPATGEIDWLRGVEYIDNLKNNILKEIAQTLETPVPVEYVTFYGKGLDGYITNANVKVYAYDKMSNINNNDLIMRLVDHESYKVGSYLYDKQTSTDLGGSFSINLLQTELPKVLKIELCGGGIEDSAGNKEDTLDRLSNIILGKTDKFEIIIDRILSTDDKKIEIFVTPLSTLKSRLMDESIFYSWQDEIIDEVQTSSETDSLSRWHNTSNSVANKLLKDKFGLTDEQLKPVDYIQGQDVELLRFNIKLNSYKEIIKYILNGILREEEYESAVRDDLQVYFGIAGTLLNYANNTQFYQQQTPSLDDNFSKTGDDYLLDEKVIEHILLATDKMCNDPLGNCKSSDDSRGSNNVWYRDGDASKIKFSDLALLVQKIAKPIFENINTISNIATGSRTGVSASNMIIKDFVIVAKKIASVQKILEEYLSKTFVTTTSADPSAETDGWWAISSDVQTEITDKLEEEIQDDLTEINTEVYALVFGPPIKPSEVVLSNSAYNNPHTPCFKIINPSYVASEQALFHKYEYKFSTYDFSEQRMVWISENDSTESESVTAPEIPSGVEIDSNLSSNSNRKPAKIFSLIGSATLFEYGHNRAIADFLPLASLDGETNICGVYVRRVLNNGLRSDWCVSHPKIFFSPPHKFRDLSRGNANVSFTSDSSYTLSKNAYINLTWEYSQNETDQLLLGIKNWKIEFYWKKTEDENYPQDPTKEEIFSNYSVSDYNASSSTLKKFKAKLDSKKYFTEGFYNIKLYAVDQHSVNRSKFESESDYNERIDSGIYKFIEETNFQVLFTDFPQTLNLNTEMGFAPTFGFKNDDITEDTQASIQLPWPKPDFETMKATDFVFIAERWESSLDANTSIDTLNGDDNIQSITDSGQWQSITAGYIRNPNSTSFNDRYILATDYTVNLDELYDKLKRDNAQLLSDTSFVGYLETTFDTKPISELINGLRNNANDEENQRLHYFRIQVKLKGENSDSKFEVSSPLIYDLRKLKSPTVESLSVFEETPTYLSLKIGNLPALIKTSGEDSDWGLNEYDSANINPAQPYGVFGESFDRIPTNQTTSFEMSIEGGEFSEVTLDKGGILRLQNPISFQKRTISLRTVSSNSAILPSVEYGLELGFAFKKITFTKLATYSDENHVYSFNKNTNTADVSIGETDLYLEWEDFGSNLPELYGGLQANGLEKLRLIYTYKITIGGNEPFILENNYFDISDYIKENDITIADGESMEINVVALDESNEESLSEDFKINWKSQTNNEVQLEFALGLVRDTPPSKSSIPVVEWEWHFNDNGIYANTSPKIKHYELTLNGEPVKNKITRRDSSSKFKSALTIKEELDYFEKGIRNTYVEKFDAPGDYTLGVTAVLTSGQRTQEFEHTISVNFETPKPPKSIQLLNTRESGINEINYQDNAEIKFVEADEPDRLEIDYYEVKLGSNLIEVDRENTAYNESDASFTLQLDTEGLQVGGGLNIVSVVPINKDGVTGEGKQLQFAISYTEQQLTDASDARSITKTNEVLGLRGMIGHVSRYSDLVILPPNERTNDISELDSSSFKIGMAVSVRGTDVYTGEDYLLSARFNKSGDGWTPYQPIPLPSECEVFHTQDSLKVIVSPKPKFREKYYEEVKTGNKVYRRVGYAWYSRNEWVDEVVKKWHTAGATFNVSRYSYENGYDYNLVVDNFNWKQKAEDDFSMYIFSEESQNNVSSVFEKSETQKQFNHDKPTGKYFELLGSTTMCSNEDGSLIAFGDPNANGKLPSVQKYSIKIDAVGLEWNNEVRVLKTESEPFKSTDNLNILKDYSRSFRLDAFERDTIVTNLAPCDDANERTNASGVLENVNQGIAVKFSKFEKPSGEWKLFSYSNKLQEINVPELDKNVEFAGNNIAMSKTGNKVAIGLLSTPNVEVESIDNFDEFDISLESYTENSDIILKKHYASPSSYDSPSVSNLTKPVATVIFNWKHNQYVYYEVSYKKNSYSDWDIVWCDSAENELTQNKDIWHFKTTLPKLNEPKREYNKLMNDGSTVYANIYNANVEFCLKYNSSDDTISFRVEGQKIEDDETVDSLLKPNDDRYNRQIRVTAYDKNGVSQTKIYGAYSNSGKIYAVLLDSYITPKKKILSHTPIIATLGVDPDTKVHEGEYQYINWGGHFSDEYNPSDYMESISTGGSFKRPNLKKFWEVPLSVESESADSKKVDYISAETKGRSPWVNSAAEFSAEKIVLSDDGSTMAVKLRPGLKRDNENIILVKVFRVNQLKDFKWEQLGQGFINNRFVNERGDVSLSGDGNTLALSKVTENEASFTIFELSNLTKNWEEVQTKERTKNVHDMDFSSAYKRSKYRLVTSHNKNHKFTHELVRLDAKLADNGYGSDIKLSVDGKSILVSAPDGINDEITIARTTGRIHVYEDTSSSMRYTMQVSPQTALEQSVQDKIFKNISTKYQSSYGVTFSDIGHREFNTKVVEQSTAGEDNHYLGSNVFKLKGNLNFNTQPSATIGNSGPKGPSNTWFYTDVDLNTVRSWQPAPETEILYGDFVKTYTSIEVFNINDFRKSIVLPRFQIYRVMNTFDTVPLIGYTTDDETNKSVKTDISDKYIAIEVVDNNSVASAYLLNRAMRTTAWDLVRSGYATPDNLPPHKIDDIYRFDWYPSKNYAIAGEFYDSGLNMGWTPAYKQISKSNSEKVFLETNPQYLVEIRESGKGNNWYKYPNNYRFEQMIQEEGASYWLSTNTIDGYNYSEHRRPPNDAETHFRVTARDESLNLSEASDIKYFYNIHNSVIPKIDVDSIKIDGDTKDPTFSWDPVLNDEYYAQVESENYENQLTWSNVGYILTLWKAPSLDYKQWNNTSAELVYTSEEISETSYKFPVALENFKYYVLIYVIADAETNFYLDEERTQFETTKRRYLVGGGALKEFNDIGYTTSNPILRGWRITSAKNNYAENIGIHEEVSDYTYTTALSDGLPANAPFEGSISNTIGTDWENSSWYILPLLDDDNNNKKVENFTFEIASYKKLENRFFIGKFDAEKTGYSSEDKTYYFNYADLTEGDYQTVAKIEIYNTDANGESVGTTPVFESEYETGIKTGEFVSNGHTFNVIANGNKGYPKLATIPINSVNENTDRDFLRYKLVKKKFEIDLSGIDGLGTQTYNVKIKMSSFVDGTPSGDITWNETNHRLYVLNKNSEIAETQGNLLPSISNGYLDSAENVKIGEPIKIEWNDISNDSAFEPIIYKVTFDNSTLTNDLNDINRTSKYKNDFKNKTDLKISRKSEQSFQYVIPADVYSITDTTNITGTITAYLYDMPLKSEDFYFKLFENKLEIFLDETQGSGIEHTTGDTMKWAYYLDIKDVNLGDIFDRYELKLYRYKTSEISLGDNITKQLVEEKTRSVNATDGGVEALNASSPNNAYEFYDEYIYDIQSAGAGHDDFYTYELHITVHDKFGDSVKIIDGKSFVPAFAGPTNLEIDNSAKLSWEIPSVTARKTTSSSILISNGIDPLHEEDIPFDNKSTENTLEYALTTSGLASGKTYDVVVRLKYYDQIIAQSTTTWAADHTDLSAVRNIRLKNAPKYVITSENNFYHDAEADEMWSSTMVQQENGELKKVEWNNRVHFNCINPIEGKGNFEGGEDKFAWTWDPVEGADGYKTEVKSYRLFQTWITPTPNEEGDDWYADLQPNNPVEHTEGDPALLYKYTAYFIQEIGAEDDVFKDDRFESGAFQDQVWEGPGNVRYLWQEFLDEYVTPSDAARPDINRKVGNWGILNSKYNASDDRILSLVNNNHFLGFLHICFITPYTGAGEDKVYGETHASDPIMFSDFKPRVGIEGFKNYISMGDNLDLSFIVKHDPAFLPQNLENSVDLEPISGITITHTDASQANAREYTVDIDNDTNRGFLQLNNHDTMGRHTIKIEATSQFNSVYTKTIHYEVVAGKGYFRDLPNRFEVPEFTDITLPIKQRPLRISAAPTLELPKDSFEYSATDVASYLNRFADYDYSEQKIEEIFKEPSDTSNITYLPGDIIRFEGSDSDNTITARGTRVDGNFNARFINYGEYSVGYRKYIETNAKHTMVNEYIKDNNYGSIQHMKAIRQGRPWQHRTYVHYTWEYHYTPGIYRKHRRNYNSFEITRNSLGQLLVRLNRLNRSIDVSNHIQNMHNIMRRRGLY